MHTCIPDHLSPPYHIGHNTAHQMGISWASDHACCSARHNRAFTETKTEMQQFDYQVFHELCPLLVCTLHMHSPFHTPVPVWGKPEELIQNVPKVWRRDVLLWVIIDAAVSKGCAWKNSTVPGMHPQGKAVKWAWNTGYEEVTTARQTACGQGHTMGKWRWDCAQPLSILTQALNKSLRVFGPQLLSKGHCRPLVKATKSGTHLWIELKGPEQSSWTVSSFHIYKSPGLSSEIQRNKRAWPPDSRCLKSLGVPSLTHETIIMPCFIVYYSVHPVMHCKRWAYPTHNTRILSKWAEYLVHGRKGHHTTSQSTAILEWKILGICFLSLSHSLHPGINPTYPWYIFLCFWE